MADINKLKDKIKSTIYPNGKGAINASDHQAMLLDMADGMAETDTKLAELSGEVVELSAEVITSTNLYNENDEDVKVGYRLNSTTGELVEDSTLTLTGYIPVIQGHTYYAWVYFGSLAAFSARNNIDVRIYLYDSNKHYLSFLSNSSYTCAKGISYIRIAYLNKEYKGFLLGENDAAIHWVAYKPIIRDGLVSEIVANFDALSKQVNTIERATTTSTNLYNEEDEDVKVGYRLNSTTGELVEDSTVTLTGYIPVIQGHTYYAWIYYNDKLLSSDAISSRVRVYAYDINKRYLSFASGASFNISEGVSYIRVAFDNSYTFLLGENATAIDWQPYSLVAKVNIADIADNIVKELSRPINLPTIVYAFANQPLKIQFDNIVAYNERGVYWRVISSAKGKQTSKAWEYLPTSAETFNLDYYIYDLFYRSLQEQDRHQIKVVKESQKPSLTILAIGDSFINTGVQTQTMLDLADSDNYPLTLLGTRGTEGNPNQHEGRGGWTAAMFAHSASNTSGSVTNAFYNPTTKVFDFAYYMTSQGYDNVDCVFLQLGVNDVFSPKKDADLIPILESYISDMKLMIDSILAFDSDIKVVVNMPPPQSTDQDATGELRGVSQTAWRARYNIYLLNKAIIDNLQGYNANVYINPLMAAIDCDTEMIAGDVHPTTEGYTKLGTEMYSFMRAIN